MRVLLTDEQVELQQAARQLFEKGCPTSLVRDLQADDTEMNPTDLWATLQRFGLFGLAFPEALGGSGATIFELGLMYREAGRVLCPAIVYSTIEFGLAVDLLGGQALAEVWVPRVAAGELRASAAACDPSNAADVRPILVAELRDGEYHLSGRLVFVRNADVVDELLVTARVVGQDGPGQVVMLIVSPSAAGVRTERLRTQSREVQCEVHFNDVVVADADRVAHLGENLEPLRRLSNVFTALQCLEMVGGAESTLDRTVEYVMSRHQFGRPLAGFQAVQHHVANVRIAVDGARLAAFQAAWWLARGRTAEREVAVAKLQAGRAYKIATLTGHQLHGGMGYLRETDLHLWSERAKATELRGGATEQQLERIARQLQF